jgi:membrane dipeptidase
VTLEASFLAVPHKATVDDVFRHIDHFLYLGAENCLGFGSDFDGTSNPLPGLSTAADYQVFADLLVHRYGETLAHKLLSQNLERFLYERLPADGSCQAT